MIRKKYTELELFRFVLSVMIVYYHLLLKLSALFPDETVYSTLSGYNHIGRSGVLPFFVFSGFFLYKSLTSSGSVESFVKKKIIRFWPVMAFTLLINFNGKGDFYNLFFLSPGMGVVKTASSNPAMWYVCCLFWISIIYFLLFSGCSEKQWRRINAILFITVIIGLGLISHKTTSLKYDALVSENIPFLTNGFTYGIIGISIGILFAQLKPGMQIKSKGLVSMIQFTLMGYFVWLNTMCSTIHEMIFYIVWSLIIMYFLIYQQGIPVPAIGKKCDLFSLLGKWSFSIYAMQFPCFAILRKIFLIGFFRDLSPVVIIIFSMMFCLLGGIAVHYFIERPATEFLDRKLKVV